MGSIVREHVNNEVKFALMVGETKDVSRYPYFCVYLHNNIHEEFQDVAPAAGLEAQFLVKQTLTKVQHRQKLLHCTEEASVMQQPGKALYIHSSAHKLSML